MPGTTPLYGAFLDTVGLEMEGIGIFQNRLSKDMDNIFYGSPTLSKNGKKIIKPYIITRDASTESIVESVTSKHNMYYIYRHTEYAKRLAGMGRGNDNALGYELIIEPTGIEQLEELVFKTLLAIENAGDFITPRAATHFHVGFVNNLRMLQNLLRITLWLDPLFFRLGGMGRTNRGFSNNYAYARPLLHSSAVPVVGALDSAPRIHVERGDSSVRNRPRSTSSVDRLSSATERLRRNRIARLTDEINDGNTYVKIINPISALSATSLEDFWASFGVFPDVSGLPKYHPARYSSFNFYSLSQHNTIEARHCNQTFNPYLVMAIAKMFRGAVELSTLLGKHEVFEFPPGNSAVEISIKEAEEILQTLQNFFNDKEVENPPDDSEFSLIMETIANSKFIPLKENPVKTHLNDFSIRAELARAGNLETVENVTRPTQIDVHTIRNYPFVSDNK